MAILTGVSERRRLRPQVLAVIALAPIATHAVLLALWWALLQPWNGHIEPGRALPFSPSSPAAPPCSP